LAKQDDIRGGGLVQGSTAPGSATTDPVVGLADIARRAGLFERIRQDHASELAEDYLELISDLIETTGEARLVDLASLLGVSRPTVNAMIGRLQREELVDSKPYRSIFLTDKGRAVAERSRERHRIVLGFLQAIGVPEDIAEADAEGLEHHVSEVTLEALIRATEKLRS
jgi:DtxR family manganese transport transcriptional regulator